MKKNIILRFLVAALVVFTLFQIPSKSSAQVSFQVFYDDLAPYGQWVNDPYYGYVWQPSIGSDFRPYCTDGYWVMTDYGNTWVSDYPWGWAPFHYGRWVLDDAYGWVWIPGNTWGPGWVCWRDGGGYYGWAPLGPGIGLYAAPDPWWIFCPYGHFGERGFHDYYYGPRGEPFIHTTVIVNNTYVRNNITYYIGPKPEDVRRETGRNVTVLTVNRGGSKGAAKVAGNSISIYGPHVTRTTATSANPAPAKVVASTHPINSNAVISQNKNVRLPAPRNPGATAKPTSSQPARASNPSKPNSGSTVRQAHTTTQKQSQPQHNPAPAAKNTARPASQPHNNPAPQPQHAAPAQHHQAQPRPQQQARPAPAPRPQPQQAPRPEEPHGGGEEKPH